MAAAGWPWAGGEGWKTRRGEQGKGKEEMRGCREPAPHCSKGDGGRLPCRGGGGGARYDPPLAKGAGGFSRCFPPPPGAEWQEKLSESGG